MFLGPGLPNFTPFLHLCSHFPAFSLPQSLFLLFCPNTFSSGSESPRGGQTPVCPVLWRTNPAQPSHAYSRRPTLHSPLFTPTDLFCCVISVLVSVPGGQLQSYSPWSGLSLELALDPGIWCAELGFGRGRANVEAFMGLKDCYCINTFEHFDLVSC